MIDLSTIKEEQIVVSEDKKTAIRYKVVEETIDLMALKRELADRKAANEYVDKLNAFRQSLLPEQQGYVINLPYQELSELEDQLAKLEK